MKTITHWLYYGETVVTAVRALEGTPAQDIRSLALASLARVPLCDRPTENPSDKARRILHATVRTFPTSGRRA